MNIRQEALEILTRWEKGGVFAESLIDDADKRLQLWSSDRGLLNALVNGVLRHKLWLDYVIDELSGHKKIQKDIRFLARLGLVQILVLNIPSHAAVNETVRMVPQRARGFVNALLRRADREKASILEQREGLSLSLRYSTPAWLVKRWLKFFGEDSVQKILAGFQEIPHLYARKNPHRSWIQGYIPEGLVSLEAHPGWYEVKGALPYDELDAGILYISDPSTQAAITLLDPQSGETILDACAAPGGKSMAILAATGGDVHLVATDAMEYRLPRLEENLSKERPLSLFVDLYDWTQPCPSEWKNKFDAVLLDVPCSNTGVIQRRVDVRWRLSAEEMNRISRLQLSILEAALPAVKSGGRLVYSTCSIDPEENSLLIEEFLKKHSDWSLEKEVLTLPYELKTDGAYAARLIKA